MKIAIFMLIILLLINIPGSVMYLAENQQNGFSVISESIYWAIITITTNCYGNMSPVKPLGNFYYVDRLSHYSCTKGNCNK